MTHFAATCGHANMKITKGFLLVILSFVIGTKQDSEYGKIRIVIRSETVYLNDVKESLGKYTFHFENKVTMCYDIIYMYQ